MQINIKKSMNALIKRNISAHKLKKLTGLSINTAYKFARHGGAVTTESVYKVARALEIEPADLIESGPCFQKRERRKRQKKSL